MSAGVPLVKVRKQRSTERGGTAAPPDPAPPGALRGPGQRPAGLFPSPPPASALHWGCTWPGRRDPRKTLRPGPDRGRPGGGGQRCSQPPCRAGRPGRGQLYDLGKGLRIPWGRPSASQPRPPQSLCVHLWRPKVGGPEDMAKEKSGLKCPVGSSAWGVRRNFGCPAPPGSRPPPLSRVFIQSHARCLCCRTSDSRLGLESGPVWGRGHPAQGLSG